MASQLSGQPDQIRFPAGLSAHLYRRETTVKCINIRFLFLLIVFSIAGRENDARDPSVRLLFGCT